MEQMQNSCLNLMQTLTVRDGNTSRDKVDSSEKNGFRKLLEQGSEQPEQVTEETTQKTRSPEAQPTEQPNQIQTGDMNVRPIPTDVQIGTDEDEEENLQIQGLAMIERLYADQRLIIGVPEPEVVQTVGTQAVGAAEMLKQTVSTGLNDGEIISGEQLGQPEQAEQVVQTVPEAIQKPAEVTDASVQQDGGPDLQEQSQVTEMHEQKSPEDDFMDTADVTQSAEKPVFEAVETAPVKVSETAAPVETTQTEPVEDQIANKLTETLSFGETRVELQLTPENLGKVTIELTQKEDGSLHIALRAENSQTRSLLERDMSGLQSLLSRTTQQEVQVDVSQPQEQQQQQNYDGHQQQQHQQQEQRENRQRSETFLNQLRLGLLIPEAEAS